jgi:hypothetical protein
MPTPLKLIARLLVVSALVLWVAHQYQRAIVEPLLPLVGATFTAVQDTFVLQSLDIADDGPNQSLRLRANLAKPIDVNGRMFYPIGWGTNEQGGYQITLTVGGAMEYSLMTLIVVLAWPFAHWQALLKRIVIALPLMLGLLLLNTTITFPAELWNPIHDEWVPDITWPLLVASKVLMGGGGLMLGLLCGALAIAMSMRTAAALSAVPQA